MNHSLERHDRIVFFPLWPLAQWQGWLDFEDRERAFFVCESLLSPDGRPPVEVTFADRCKAGLGL